MSAGAIFDQPAPRWFTIPAHRPFVDDLARGLHLALSPLGPEALADAIVLTPTRRAARALAEAFLKTGAGPAVLLPQIRAIGDLDEGEPPFEPGALALDLPPAISPLRRRFELARLVASHEAKLDHALDAAAALSLADALGAFLDTLHIEERFDPDAIAGLVEGDLARHWRRSAEFLALATELWPKRLEALGLIDASDRQVRLLRLLAEQWDRNPPDVPLIAAGSTGSDPATAEVLGVVAGAPRGCVVLPGLDLDLAEAAWVQIDEQHPQSAMQRLLIRHRVARDEVRLWPSPEDLAEQRQGRQRRRIVNEALRPADATADWLEQIGAMRAGDREGGDAIAEGLSGLSVLSAHNEEDAATCAALLLREALETPGLTCALVTPDRGLARRVSARLKRWGVEADSSAGAPLATFPVGVLAGLVARLTADPLDPVTWLAVLKHPLTRFGREPDVLQAAARALERRGLRGPRPASWDALRVRLGDAAEALALAADMHALAERLAAAVSADVGAHQTARALAEAMETLARDASGSTDGLWAGADGEAAAMLLSELIEGGATLPPATARGFLELIEGLLEGEAVRTGVVSHPRLRILGLIEARLVRSDRLVLAGLEEGVWPAAPPTDPFLSRPMKTALGLPPPERRIGLAAHDFAQAACAPEVVLLTTERRGGQPAVRSRWIWRLETLARGAEVTLPRRDDIKAWARRLDAPLTPAPPALRPAERPKPRPPVADRPRQMPVTRVETWVRDPYAVYARLMLGLRALDPPDAPIDARSRGTAVHRAFEQLARDHPDLPPDTAAAFERLLLTELEALGVSKAGMARETPLARNLSRWVEAFERERRQGARLIVETEGRLSFEGPAGAFVLTAKPDRLELRGAAADVLDFKTGAPPTPKQVQTGFAPQLTLTAAILMAGGFTDFGTVEAGELVYVRVTGRRDPAKVEARAAHGESGVLAQEALDGLRRRVAMFDREDTPYVSWSAPQFLKDRAGDYDHLARVYEWAVVGADGEAEGGE